MALNKEVINAIRFELGYRKYWRDFNLNNGELSLGIDKRHENLSREDIKTVIQIIDIIERSGMSIEETEKYLMGLNKLLGRV